MKYLIEPILQIIILVPLAILLLKDRNKENFLRVLFFALIYVVYQIALSLPYLFKPLDFIGGSWNWDGKIFGILFGVICYFGFRKYFSENDFFTFRQDTKGFRKTLAVAIFIVVLATAIAFLTGSSKFDVETLAFQLTMPGIDEEIMFRGILLGFLASSLKAKFAFLGNPAVLLNAVLFGLMHALTLDKNNSLDFEPIYFLQTAIGGYAWAWMTIKSRSILLAILSHNFSNFFAASSTMIK